MSLISRRAGIGMIALVVAACAGYGIATAAAAPAGSGPKTAPGGVHPALAPPTKPDLLFVPIQSCRIVDTSATGAGGPIAAGTVRNFYVSGSTGFHAQGGNVNGCGIPATAASIAARFTALTPTATGSFATYPTGQPTTAATLYFRTGQTIATDTPQAVAPGGAKTLAVKALSGTSNLAVDVTGYYEQQIDAYVNADGSTFSATNRVVSSARLGTGAYSVTVAADVYYCAVTATAASGSGTDAVAYTGLNGVISVVTWVAGATADAAFNLVVTC